MIIMLWMEQCITLLRRGLYKIDIGSDISQKYGSQQNNVICVVYLQMENTFILIIISTVIICGNYMAFQKTDI